ncbi:YvrJ family protein [Metabacillus fastidiosus]|uniref:YvrJ family protein n=1 Tax=Metabacillus fastidiosus TaxID=1458 RepID=A0ABU6P5R5_9BACI|nr:YvrJ family protein [Metabacillus fastidiosus]MEC2075854.1 YvrJ family protein [Metabacillus fastidiosus]MED4404027.1 YvrJ family protein [Metabacillus fastidiosus]MED4533406.1 YvrJ family protein [Metabacillus fastidiosus]
MDWMSVISEVGFPMLITFYLLNRMETKIDQLSQSINDLTISLRR